MAGIRKHKDRATINATLTDKQIKVVRKVQEEKQLLTQGEAVSEIINQYINLTK